jgi:hypothetical protein
MMEATGLSGAGNPDVALGAGACDALIGVQAAMMLAKMRAMGREGVMAFIIMPSRVHLKVHRLATITNLRAYTHMVHLEVHPTLRNLSGASLPRLQQGHV